MDHLHDDDLSFGIGEVKSLPHRLSARADLTLTLTSTDPVEKTALIEVHNPEAKTDTLVAGLIEEELDSAEAANRWRDALHVPERAIPVDTSTLASATYRVKLHERLRIGDRVWKVEAISAEGVTLRPGHDFEEHTVVNEPADFKYGPEGIAIGEQLNAVEESL